MPRQSHGRLPSMVGPSRPKKRKPAKGRGLNALQIAEKENPDVYKIRQHRLGESYEDNDDPITRQDADERSSKRRRIEPEGGEDKDDSGTDLDGERWHVMGSGDEDEEDSEIESDDAFGESDEERFAGFAFRGSKENQQRETRRAYAASAAEEDVDDGDDGDSLGEDAVDLATVWDLDDADEVDEQKRKDRERKPTHEQDDARMDDGSSTNEDANGSGEDNDAQSEFSVSDAEDGDHARLQNFVESISNKVEDTRPSPSTPNPAKISAADLLQYVKDPVQRQSLKILQSAVRKGPEIYKGGIPGRLAAPLPKRQQDRLDRSAAYDETRKELGRWVETVKQNRRAEQLSFPLADPNDPVATASRKLASTQGKPMNELERKVQEIIMESGMAKEGGNLDGELGKEDEELEEQKIPFEKVQARRAELRKQRDLMFREEIRARRIKKIKSKAYRRIHRKERAKQDLERRAEDAANGMVDSEGEREQNDRRRAEERMGRRHRDSKWARGMKAVGRAKWDEGARSAMEEVARRDEELRRRVEGRDVDEDSVAMSDEESDTYSSNEEGVALDESLAKLSKEGANEASSKLGNMAFMRRAEAAKKARNDAEIQEITRELNGENGFETKSDVEDAELVGRQTYGARIERSTKQPLRLPLERSEFEERMSEDDVSELADETATATAVLARHPTKTQRPVKANISTALNLATPESRSKYNSEEKASTDEQSKQQFLKSTNTSEPALDDFTSSSESEHEDGSAAIEGTGPLSLGDDIFAGDDTVGRDFQQEKEDIIKEEGDQIVDNGLPGWGSWAGAGISKKAQNRQKKKLLTTVKGVAPEKRQDSRLEKVIINEKRVKKNGKYLATELPHPFESRQQYERSLRLPLGPEWTTKSTFQDATRPRVLIKQGVIRPMARPQV